MGFEHIKVAILMFCLTKLPHLAHHMSTGYSIPDPLLLCSILQIPSSPDSSLCLTCSRKYVYIYPALLMASLSLRHRTFCVCTSPQNAEIRCLEWDQTTGRPPITRPIYGILRTCEYAGFKT